MADPRHRPADASASEAAGAPVVETGDLSLAAYFLVRGRERGMRFVGAVPDPSGRSRDPWYRFVDPQSAASAVATDYAGSPEAAFDGGLRTLKKIARSEFGAGVFASQAGRHAAGGRREGG